MIFYFNIMKALAKTCQKEASLGKNLYWALKKILKKKE